MEIKEIQATIEKLKEISTSFFSFAKKVCEKKKDDNIFSMIITSDVKIYWNKLPEELQAKSQEAQEMTLKVISLILPLLPSPILDKSDEKDIGVCAKKMRSALKLRKYKSWGIEVINDEGTVLGVNPPGQSENEPFHPTDANEVYSHCLEKLEGMLKLIKVAPIQFSNGLVPQNPNLHRYDTAFIMMPFDPKNPKLEDVYDAYKDCFSRFSIKTIRSKDIEHEDIITKKIIEEIKTSKFLVGDLTNERPNVYYEIGYAHSLGRKVILYREKNTLIHFDLLAYNCPEYENIKELKKILLKRLEFATNRKPKNS